MNKYFIFILVLFQTGFAQWEKLSNYNYGETGILFSVNDTILAGNENRIFISTNAGNNWIASNPISDEITFIPSAYKYGNLLFVGTYTHGVYYSKDNGVNWIHLQQGLSSTPAKSIGSFAVRENKIYIGTHGAGVFYQELNNLGTWKQFNNGLSWNSTYTINSLYNNKGTLIAGGGSSASLQLNRNDSDLWEQIDFVPFNPNGTSLLAAKNFNNKLIGAYSQGIVYSLDSGKTWSIYEGIFGNYERADIVEFNNKLIVMLSKAGFVNFYLSDYNAEKWELITQFNTNFCYDFEIANKRILAATLDGIYFYDLSTVPVEDDIIPNEINLEQNYPNPFNPATKIRYTIPKAEKSDAKIDQYNVTLIIYDILGNEITVLVNETKFPGNYEVEFNGRNFPSGIYLYQLKIDNKTLTRKMNLIK